MDTESHGTLSQFVDVLLAQGHRDIRFLSPTPMGNGTTWITVSTTKPGFPLGWETAVIQNDGQIYPIIPF